MSIPIRHRPWFARLVGLATLLVIAYVLLQIILIPQGNRKAAMTARCAMNLKSIGTAFAIYSAASNDSLPIPASAASLTSLCQQTPELRALFDTPTLPGSRPARERFYCPANQTQDPATLWSAGPVSTWGYVLLNDRGPAGAALPATFPPRTPPLQYFSNFKLPADSILALDVIVTDTTTPPFNYHPSGTAIPFASSLHPTPAPSISMVNILCADGHVDSAKFTPASATPVPQPAGGFFWFPNP